MSSSSSAALRDTDVDTTGTVISADGTTIGYRQVGRGPGLVLVHGGMMASQNFTKLGAALSDTFTVIIPDRRGRGRSGPFGPDYGIARECEDIDALTKKTGATNVFGLSSGAIIALFAAATVPGIRKVAAYEPPLAVRGLNPAHWVGRFDREIEQGKLGAAFVTVAKGTGDVGILKLVPNFVLAALATVGMRLHAKGVKAGDVPIEQLVPTMHFDARLVTETRTSIETLGALRADLLLLGGDKSAAFLGTVLDFLAEMFPRATRVRLPGVGHLAADNDGKPNLVADALRRFF
jgi:pimeloyl-ACP methyl ester carboxylesterase